MAYGRKDYFQFGLTCPLIDNGIGAIDDIVDDFFSDRLGIEDRSIYRELLDLICPEIEAIRKTNMNMRETAEDLAKDLYGEIDDLKDDLKDKEKEISRLEDKIQDLQYQLGE